MNELHNLKSKLLNVPRELENALEVEEAARRCDKMEKAKLAQEAAHRSEVEALKAHLQTSIQQVAANDLEIDRLNEMLNRREVRAGTSGRSRTVKEWAKDIVQRCEHRGMTQEQIVAVCAEIINPTAGSDRKAGIFGGWHQAPSAVESRHAGTFRNDARGV